MPKSLPTPEELRNTLHNAIVYAINEMGMDEFKKCSFFGGEK